MKPAPVERARARARRALAWLALVVLVAAGSRYTYWTFVEHRFQTITAGQVYQSGALPADRLLLEVARHGIRTVIDLRREESAALDAERELLASRGVRYVSLPSDQVPDEETVRAFLEHMQSEPRPVLIHCRDGYGRSVLFAALYRVEFEGWSAERAWRATAFLPWWGNFAPDSEKGRYLLAYQPHRIAAAPAAERADPTPALALSR